MYADRAFIMVNKA